MRSLVGDRVQSEFLDLSLPEYRGLSYEKLRQTLEAQGLGGRWDLGSWIDALNNAELAYESLDVSNGAGTLVFDQLSWPSGGIEATKMLIKIFGGVIDACDAV